jgi:hypothetical protein
MWAATTAAAAASAPDAPPAAAAEDRAAALAWAKRCAAAVRQAARSDPGVMRVIVHLRGRPEFAAFREPQLSASLPESERQAWLEFWREIAPPSSRPTTRPTETPR